MPFAVQLVLCLLCLTGTFAQIKLCNGYPESVEKCMREANNHPVNVHEADKACLTTYYANERPANTLTASDMEFFNIRDLTRYGLEPPPTGFRIRKEIRVLTDEERRRLFAAFRVLYQRGILARFGHLHATAKTSIHRGAAFLPWHRVFIADFEEELRRVDPTVSLPYWDSSIDYTCIRPTESVIWSPCFLGNGNGTITCGSFSGMYGGRNAPLQRNYARPGSPGCNGRLITKRDIQQFLSVCYFRNISTGIGSREDFRVPQNLEFLHDGVHDWVGGDMGDLGYSSYDPVFWFHHAFVDYLWEMFRRKQAKSPMCNVDPETDYRPDDDNSQWGSQQEGHAYLDTMQGYAHLLNKDGLRNSWTTHFYNYEPHPACPDCGGSKYLYCERHFDPYAYPHGLCVSHRRSACPYSKQYLRRDDDSNDDDSGEVIFEGEADSTFTQFPVIDSFSGPAGDGRHRDLTEEKSRDILSRVTNALITNAPRRTTAPPSSPTAGIVQNARFGGGVQPGLGVQSGVGVQPGVGGTGFWTGGFNNAVTVQNPVPDCYGYSGFPSNPGFMPFQYGYPNSGPMIKGSRCLYPYGGSSYYSTKKKYG